MISRDKLINVLACFVLTVVGAFLLPLGWAVLIAVVIGALKEWYLDGIMKKGTPEWGDFVADLIGIALACLVVAG